MDELGQVYTPENIARIMAQLLPRGMTKTKRTKARILDPCIGGNIFFDAVNELFPSWEMQGIEIDEQSLNKEIRNFFSTSKKNLRIENFFDFDTSKSKSFDYVITNPPYVRHEKMTGVNNKANIRSYFQERNFLIPSQSNLYVYFLIKSMDHLVDGGKLVAIVYDSWLYSSYGKSFKNIVHSMGSIESIIHFQSKAFTNADVGATIIEFVKGKKQSNSIKYARYLTADNLPGLRDVEWDIIDSAEVFEDRHVSIDDERYIALGDIADVNRGTSALSNKLFVLEAKRYDMSTIPFIKSIKEIDVMSARSNKHLLMIEKDHAKAVSSHLAKLKKHILNNEEEFLTLSRKIRRGEVWYSPKLAKPGDIIFNYYIRESYDFILNLKKHQSSDNFYNLRTNEDTYAVFALLNSTYVKRSIMNNSRLQGNGLRKIQLYEFKNVLVPNIRIFSKARKTKLNRLGVQLSKLSRISYEKDQLIKRIDNVISDELCLQEESLEINCSRIQYSEAMV